LYGRSLRKLLPGIARRTIVWIALTGVILGGLLSIGLQQEVIIKQISPNIANATNGVIDSIKESQYEGDLTATANAQVNNPPTPEPRPTPSLQKPQPSS